jgi:hypothetical protein
MPGASFGDVVLIPSAWGRGSKVKPANSEPAQPLVIPAQAGIHQIFPMDPVLPRGDARVRDLSISRLNDLALSHLRRGIPRRYL